MVKPRYLVAFRYLIIEQPFLVVNPNIVVAGSIDIHNISNVDVAKVHVAKVGSVDNTIVETGFVDNTVTDGIEMRGRDELTASKCACALVHSLLIHEVPPQGFVSTSRWNQARHVQIKDAVLRWKSLSC